MIYDIKLDTSILNKYYILMKYTNLVNYYNKIEHL